MKVVILAGGYATRLWPVTKNRAKPLLPLGRKRIIDFVYEKVSKFGDVIISTNRRFEADFLRWAEGKDVEVVVEDTTREEEKLGAVRALAYVVKDLDDDVLVIAGDNVFDFEVSQLLDVFESTGDVVVALYDVGDTELAKRYGVAEVEEGILRSFEEKPANPKSSLIGVALYVLPRDVITILQRYVRENERSDNLGDFLSYLCRRRTVRAVTVNGNWFDVGTPDSYIEALKTYMDSYVADDVEISRASKVIEPVVIESGVKITGRSIVGPYAYIGEGCEIESSDVSECVLFEKNVLRRVRLWRSIVDDRCEIRNIELSGSVIGGHAKIQRG
ncbi:MAG: NDP-sugar synthase [Archaeoglobaceae archaeon]